MTRAVESSAWVGEDVPFSGEGEGDCFGKGREFTSGMLDGDGTMTSAILREVRYKMELVLFDFEKISGGESCASMLLLTDLSISKPYCRQFDNDYKLSILLTVSLVLVDM